MYCTWCVQKAPKYRRESLTIVYCLLSLLCYAPCAVLKLLRTPDSVSLSDLLAVYRCIVRASSIAQLLLGASGTTSSASTSSTETAQQQSALLPVVASLQLSVGKSAKYLALLEEIVDLQRIHETYGTRKRDDSPVDDLAAAQEAEEEVLNYEASRASAGLFHDKWVRVRPNFSPQLHALYQDILAVQSSMLQEHLRVVELCSSLDPSGSSDSKASKGTKRGAAAGSTPSATEPAESKVVMLEISAVHGPHLRATKRLATAVLKILNSSASSSSSKGPLGGAAFLRKSGADECAGVTVLSQQKAGTLFLTTQVSLTSPKRIAEYCKDYFYIFVIFGR